MDKNLFETGLKKRKATLGAEYVQKSLDGADDFSRPFQEAMTAWCWGFGWGDEVIDVKTRSMMNLSMIGALGKMTEWEWHCRGAIKNGVTREELRAIIHVIGIYCGVPQALECMRAARKVLDEAEPDKNWLKAYLPNKYDPKRGGKSPNGSLRNRWTTQNREADVAFCIVFQYLVWISLNVADMWSFLYFGLQQMFIHSI